MSDSTLIKNRINMKATKGERSIFPIGGMTFLNVPRTGSVVFWIKSVNWLEDCGPIHERTTSARIR